MSWLFQLFWWDIWGGGPYANVSSLYMMGPLGYTLSSELEATIRKQAIYRCIEKSEYNYGTSIYKYCDMSILLLILRILIPFLTFKVTTMFHQMRVYSCQQPIYIRHISQENLLLIGLLIHQKATESNSNLKSTFTHSTTSRWVMVWSRVTRPDWPGLGATTIQQTLRPSRMLGGWPSKLHLLAKLRPKSILSLPFFFRQTSKNFNNKRTW